MGCGRYHRSGDPTLCLLTLPCVYIESIKFRHFMNLHIFAHWWLDEVAGFNRKID